MKDVSLFHLYALRALFALIAVGQGMIQWPLIVEHAGQWTLMSSVAHVMLAALATLSLLGVLHPLKMLPLMFFELLWKVMWLSLIALPRWQSGKLDADFSQTAFETGLGIIVLAAIPWRYVWANYVRGPMDRWR